MRYMFQWLIWMKNELLSWCKASQVTLLVCLHRAGFEPLCGAFTFSFLFLDTWGQCYYMQIIKWRHPKMFVFFQENHMICYYDWWLNLNQVSKKENNQGSNEILWGVFCLKILSHHTQVKITVTHLWLLSFLWRENVFLATLCGCTMLKKLVWLSCCGVVVCIVNQCWIWIEIVSEIPEMQIKQNSPVCVSKV